VRTFGLTNCWEDITHSKTPYGRNYRLVDIQKAEVGVKPQRDPKRPLETLRDPKRPQETPGDPKRPQETLRGP
jgi:hypothetical protein